MIVIWKDGWGLDGKETNFLPCILLYLKKDFFFFTMYMSYLFKKCFKLF